MQDVFFLDCGTFDVPTFAVAPRGRGWGRSQLSLTVGVAVRESGEVVLVDCGFSEKTCEGPRRSIGAVYTVVLGLRLAPERAAVRQLAALGIAPSRVTTIVATHLHLDHIGGWVDFPGAELVCSTAELEAFSRRSGLSGYRAGDLAGKPPPRAVTLDGPAELGFPSSHDLFGDGQVLLLEANGHTPGHVAVALQGAERLYVHTGDAADQLWEYGLEPPGPSLQGRVIGWSTEELRRTYGFLRACEADARRPVIVPTHDRSVFERIPHGPRPG